MTRTKWKLISVSEVLIVKIPWGCGAVMTRTKCGLEDDISEVFKAQ
jgi:hypothetical protein